MFETPSSLERYLVCSFSVCHVLSHVITLCWTLHISELPIKESILLLLLLLLHTIVVPYELYELYDWGKVPELYNGRGTLWNFTNFTLLGCSLFSAGVYEVGLQQLTKILYVIIILCYMLS